MPVRESVTQAVAAPAATPVLEAAVYRPGPPAAATPAAMSAPMTAAAPAPIQMAAESSIPSAPLPVPPPAAAPTLEEVYRAALAQQAAAEKSLPSSFPGPGSDQGDAPVVIGGSGPVPSANNSGIGLSPVLRGDLRRAQAGTPLPASPAPASQAAAMQAPGSQTPGSQARGAAPALPAAATSATGGYTVNFAGNSAELDAADRKVLTEVARAYRSVGGSLRIIGHASHGTNEKDAMKQQLVNFRLSGKRADAVAAELARLGVPWSAMTVAAMSDSEPLYVDGKGAEARNRRVEILFGR